MAPSATNGSGGAAGLKSIIQFDTFSNVINGKLVSTSKTRHGINPANKKANWEVPIARPEDVDEAVTAGKIAFRKWSKTSVEERRKALLEYADALDAYKEEFAQLLTTEQGKPVSHQFDDSSTHQYAAMLTIVIACLCYIGS